MKKLLVLFGLMFAIFACSNDCMNVDVPQKNSNKNNQSNTDEPEKHFTTLQDVVDNANAGDEIDLSNYELTSYTATINKKLTIKNGSLSGANLTVTSENVMLEKLTDLSVASSSRLTINDSKLSNLLIGGNGETSRSRASEAQTSLAMVSLTDSEIENVELNGFNSQLNITDTATKIDDIITSTKSMIILEAGKYDGMKDPVVTDNGELTRIDMTKDKTLSILSIYSNPKKAEYKLNEEIDLTGLIVMGTYTASVEIFKSGGWKGEATESVTKWEDEEDYDVDYDFSKTGVRIVTIKSTINPDVACNFYVYVVDDSQNNGTSQPEKIEFTNIRVESLLLKPKTSYKVGEKLDLSGYRVMGTYNGLDVNLQYTSEPANGTVLEKDVVVKFYYANQEIGKGISIKVTQPYTVKFYDGIDSSKSKPLYTLEAVDGELLKLPSDPNRENYIFDGWYNGETRVTAGQTINGNLELTAKWTANGYTIKYELNGGTNDQSNPSNYNVESETITLAAATKTGYTFGGWYKDENFSGEKITQIAKGSTGNLTLYAQWTANKYTVKFDANGGDGKMANQTFTYGEQQALAINKFTRDDYTFAGWATTASGNVTYADEQKVSNLIATANGEVILYAVWTKNGTVLPVTFYPPSGTPVDYGDTITLSCATDGATIYYTTGDTAMREYTAPIKITDNEVMIVAKAAKSGMSPNDDSVATYIIKTYTVTYKSEHGTAPSDIAGLKKGDILTSEKLPTLTAGGYTFSGWYDGENKIEAELTITGDLTLTAKWTPNTYSVIFNANVSDNSVTDTMDDQTFTYDVAKDLTANAFTREDYTFAGWNTKANGCGTSYADKASVLNLTATANGEVTLYAQWAEANAYYVSSTGDDSKAGTYFAPFKTLQKAVNTAITSNDGETTYTIYVMDDITGEDGDFDTTNCALINIDPTYPTDPTKKLYLKICGTQNADDTYTTINANRTYSYSTNSSGTKGGVMYIGANADVTLENITLTDGATDNIGGGVLVFGGALTMKSGATISNCTALEGGGVYLLEGNFTMNGGSIENCKSDGWTDLGGGVHVAGGTFSMKDGIISNCTSEQGGGVYVANGKITMEGGTISNCTAITHGGGVYLASTVENAFTMEGGTINECKAINPSSNNDNCYGGGVYLASNTTFKMTGGTISKCEVKNSCSNKNAYGGGVYLGGSGCTFTMSESAKIDNCKAEQGGGVYQAGGRITMSGGTISGCTAEQGGGVYQGSDGVFNMNSKITISNCTAQKGGGVYQANGDFTMYGGTIGGETENLGCTAEQGGGVYQAGGKFTMSGGSITWNSATSTSQSALGGGVYVGVEFEMKGGSISQNSVFSSCNSGMALGGGVYVKAGAVVRMMSKTNENTSTGSITNNSVSYTGSNTNCSGGGGVAIDADIGSNDNVYGGRFTMKAGVIENNTIGNGLFGKDVLVRGSENYPSGPYFEKQDGAIVGSDVVYK